MVVMDEHQKSLLFAVINEYIKNAQPVSSKWIAECGDFDASTATLRNELALLDEDGFLYQPHTSAGRVPTDKGYRTFVNMLLDEIESRTATRELGERSSRRMTTTRELGERSSRRMTAKEETIARVLQQIMRLRAEEHSLFAELGRTLASLSSSTVFSGPISKEKIMFKSGIHEVLSQPELEDISMRKHFGDIVDSMEANLKAFYSILENDKPTVLIGKENPINNAKDFSMIIMKHRIFGGEDGIIVMFGPKRMNYEKNLRLLQTLINEE